MMRRQVGRTGGRMRKRTRRKEEKKRDEDKDDDDDESVNEEAQMMMARVMTQMTRMILRVKPSGRLENWKTFVPHARKGSSDKIPTCRERSEKIGLD